MDNLRARFGLSDTRLLSDYPLSAVSGSIEAARQLIWDEGLSCLIMTAKDHELCRNAVRETWVYVYDRDKLQKFLDPYKDMLTEADWPTVADDFVFYLSRVHAPANTALFDMVHLCYGNDLATSDNGWLRRNAQETGAAAIASQRSDAEYSRHRFNAFLLNDRASAEWLLEQAKAYNIGAMIDVSLAYEESRGFTKDHIEAAYWYGLQAALEARMLADPQVAANVRRNANLADPFARVAAPGFRLTQEEEAEVKARIEAKLAPAGAQPKNQPPKL